MEELCRLCRTLPEPFDLIKQCPVHKDCTIRFEGHTYAVPFEYVYKTVEVRGCSGTVQIVDRRTGTDENRTDSQAAFGRYSAVARSHAGRRCSARAYGDVLDTSRFSHFEKRAL